MFVTESLIVIVISLLFWGKVSKDALENKPKMDVIKTIIYFALSVIVAIIYYKSSQVEESVNYVEIRKFIGSTDDKGQSSDSVCINISHRMKPDNLKVYAQYEDFNLLGGVELTFKSKREYRNLAIDSTKLYGIYQLLYQCLENPKLNKEIPDTNCLNDVINRYKEEKYQLRPKLIEAERSLLSKGAIKDTTQLIDALHYIFQDQRSLFFITHIPPKRKTFFPIDIYSEDEVHYEEGRPNPFKYCVKNKAFLKEFIDPNLIKKGLTEDYIKKELDHQHMTCYQYYIGNSSIPHKGYIPHTNDSMSFLRLENSDSLINYVDYFTASDMSQRIYTVNFYSEVPIYYLAITFDEPINLSEIYPEPDTLSMNQIIYTDQRKLDYFKTRSLSFHAKMPTYENKQLLRSLILTTILTAVFSLFCTNLYLCGKGIVNGLIRTRTISEEEKKKYKKRLIIYQWLVLFIVTIIAAIPIWLYCRYLSNNTLLLKADNFVTIILKAISVLIVIIIAISIWNMKLIPINKKNETPKLARNEKADQEEADLKSTED